MTTQEKQDERQFIDLQLKRIYKHILEYFEGDFQTDYACHIAVPMPMYRTCALDAYATRSVTGWAKERGWKVVYTQSRRELQLTPPPSQKKIARELEDAPDTPERGI